jgi:tetratricopeptide (TPR) repeat protein
MSGRMACCRILVLTVAFALIASIPQQVSAQSQKGVELYSSGQFKDAEAAFREALKSNPSDTPNNYYLGLSVLLQEKHSEALDIFLKVKKGQDRANPLKQPAIPDEYQINLAMARARLGLKQYDEAWKNLESARIENGSSSDVHVYRGVYYYQQDMFNEALKELEKAVSLDKSNPYAYYYEGLTYYKMSVPAKAVDALKMFLQLHPSAPEAAEAKALVDKLC